MNFSIRYAQTSDGVSIAWAAAGEGRPIVLVPVVPYGNLEMTPQVIPGVFELFTGLGRLIWYDARGTGMSDRSAVDFSVEAMLRDFEAVASRIEGTMAVVGLASAGGIALAAAANFPEQVDHVIVADIWGWAHKQPLTPTASLEQAIRGQDPALYGQTVARLLFDFASDPAVDALGAYITQSCDPGVLLQGVHANDERDIRDLLGRIKQPVLITHGRNNRFQPVGEARKLAAALPDAELVFVDDPFFADSMPHWRRFLGGADPHPPVREESLRTILFTDLESHTAMMSRLGDAKGRDLLREHERLTRAALRAHGGSEVKSMGDGFMASFGSAQRAIECARAIQAAFAQPVLGETLKVRIGLNAGEPVAENGDLFGASVIAASRIAAKAEGGQVLVANVVRELVAGKGFLFHDTGEHVLRGLEEPVRVWGLRLEDTAG